MQRTEVLIDPVDAIKGTGLALIVGAVFAYFQSIWKKAVKSDVDEIIKTARTDAAAAIAAAKVEAAAGIAAIRLEMEKSNAATDRRISSWEQRAGSFVTHEAMAELEKKMDRMEFRIESSINKITDRLDKLLEARERHS